MRHPVNWNWIFYRRSSLVYLCTYRTLSLRNCKFAVGPVFVWLIKVHMQLIRIYILSVYIEYSWYMTLYQKPRSSSRACSIPTWRKIREKREGARDEGTFDSSTCCRIVFLCKLTPAAQITTHTLTRTWVWNGPGEKRATISRGSHIEMPGMSILRCQMGRQSSHVYDTAGANKRCEGIATRWQEVGRGSHVSWIQAPTFVVYLSIVICQKPKCPLFFFDRIFFSIALQHSVFFVFIVHSASCDVPLKNNCYEAGKTSRIILHLYGLETTFLRVCIARSFIHSSDV